MEPRRHRRGDSAAHTFKTTVIVLQWSHDVTVVEIAFDAGGPKKSLTASMEPRRHRRGDAGSEVASDAARRASMEPRRHRRGDNGAPNSWLAERRGFNGATTSPSWRC